MDVLPSRLGIERRALGLRRRRIVVVVVGRTRLGKLRAELVGGIRPEIHGRGLVGLAPLSPPRHQPEGTHDGKHEASHGADGTLARLPAMPVAPFTRSGVKEAGPTKTMGSVIPGRWIREL